MREQTNGESGFPPMGGCFCSASNPPAPCRPPGWLPPLSNFRGCVALGRIFGTTFLASPPSALSSCSTASGLWTRPGRGRGRAFRKVVPKFLPRATQTPNFPPGGCGLRGGGGSVYARAHKAGVWVSPYSGIFSFSF